MGNLMTCNVISPLILKNNKAARVIFPGGEVRQFRELIKAAEIMLECPNYFVVNANGLSIGRRFSGLSADEDLEFGNLYIVLHMRRVNSFVTAADMAGVLLAANTAAKRISGGGQVRISPVGGAEAEEMSGSESVESPRKLEAGDIGREYMYRLSVCRSRKPMLDTIFEELVLSR